MNKAFEVFRHTMVHWLNRTGLGMRGKLISLFVIIKVAPLILLALLAWRQSWSLGEELRQRTEELAHKATTALAETGDIATADAIAALDNSARDNIERLTTDTAQRVAAFLYDRDADIRTAADLETSTQVYARFIANRVGRIVLQEAWELNPDKNIWQPATKSPSPQQIESSIKENSRAFSYRPPEHYTYETRPLFLEMTFVDMDGMERIKVVSTERMSSELKDISRRENTYARAETYFSELKKLAAGEIYVSKVIGTYVPSNVIGMFTPESAAKVGVPFKPEEQAYAGMENPLGKPFKGVVRWATPVVKKGKIVGYVTLALDHDHLMEFTSHIMPTEGRYTSIPSAHEGNYAFIWDFEGRSIVHPRHHSIAGYHPETGEPQVPWLEDRIYDRWQASSQPYTTFIQDEPTFVEQSNTKKPASELTKAGLVGLDCRYLNFAPQCTGWFDLTQDGGSGSFTILWSGLWKLTTAATIPYYTGQYAQSPRGFGFVAIGAGLEDFHKPATVTSAVIRELIKATDNELDTMVTKTQEVITSNLRNTAISISFSTALMTLVVVLIAIWLASAFTRSITRIVSGLSRFRNGERQFRFHSPAKDELGALCDSFDKMADTIVNSAQGSLVITDNKGIVVYANDECLRLHGKTLDQMTGRAYDEAVFFAKDTPLNAAFDEHSNNICCHNERYYKGMAEEYKNEENHTIGHLITATDVTDMVLEQKIIEAERALLETIFTFSPDILWYKNAEGRYLAANPRFLSLCRNGITKAEGLTDSDMLPPDLVQANMQNEQLALSTRGPIRKEESIIFADGHQETVDVVLTPIHDATEALVGIMGVARDVSERVTIERELRETQQHLRQAVAKAIRASESKSGFLARMSHEIRTPMNAVIGLSGIARRKLDTPSIPLEEVRDHMEQIETSAQHLLGLLNEILEISKIEADKIELAHEGFDLPKLVKDVSAIIEPRCLEKCLTFNTHIDELPWTHFLSDPLRLRQVLINILGNAIKFTPEQGCVTFRIQQKDIRDTEVLLEFSIQDSGIGIDAAAIETLFSPFEQCGAEITRQFGGTGLGLTISKSIVNLLGGDITVTSSKGEGSIFSFALWLPQAHELEAQQDQRDYGVLQGMRILLVDDVDINRMIVMEILNELDVRIDEASNGKEALEAFAASPMGHYDLILMDVQMPVMDGYAATEAIRALQHPDALRVPIVALTANSFKEDVEKAQVCGMDAHLAKPLEYDKLMDTLFWAHSTIAAKAFQL